MTGGALNYELRVNTGPDAAFLKILSKIMVTTNFTVFFLHRHDLSLTNG